MAVPTVVADYGDLCGECPVWDVDGQTLYWTDLSGNRFYSYHPASGQHRIVRSGVQISGFRRRCAWGFLIAGYDGIAVLEENGDIREVADRIEGAKCAINDCAADPAGRFLAGSTFYDPAREYALGALFIIDTNGKGRVLDEGFHLANGTGFSPDGRTPYFTETMARTIYAYDYDPTRGTAANRCVPVRVPDTEGIPDGLTVDANPSSESGLLGRIWRTGTRGPVTSLRRRSRSRLR